MATLNIRRVGYLPGNLAIYTDQFKDVSDPFYRYKMERIQSKVEGKGNGIKTVIVNLSSVASSLSRPPSCKSTIIARYPLCVLTKSQILSNILGSSSAPRPTTTLVMTAGSSTVLTRLLSSRITLTILVWNLH